MRLKLRNPESCQGVPCLCLKEGGNSSPSIGFGSGWGMMVMLMNILLVMAGGSIGALSRYAVSVWAARLLGTRFPWGTLTVNLAGCFLIGLAFALAERGFNIMNPSMRLFFVTGYLGALTTFSTFGLETVNSLREGT